MTTMSEPSREGLERLLARDPANELRRHAALFDELAHPLDRALVLHGAGNLGAATAERLRRHGVEPIAFSDSNPAAWGTRRAGLPVLPPWEAAQRHGRSAAFVPTIWNHGVYYPSVVEQLRALGCERVVPCQALFCKYPSSFLPYYQIDLPHRILEAAPRVRAAFGLLGDEDSRRAFLDMLRWSLDLEFPRPAHGLGADRYFPDDLRTLRADEVFLDVGAFDGDTLEDFVAKTGGAFARAVAFEPDPENFARLEARLATMPPDVRRRVDARRQGVGATAGTMGFVSAGASSTAAASGAALEVECVTLDSLAGELRPTYVKMDVEAMELAALGGARSLLRETAPALAVCTYHRLDHLWEVPLAIRDIRQDYAIHLRRYPQPPWEMVCYAVAPPRATQGWA